MIASASSRSAMHASIVAGAPSQYGRTRLRARAVNSHRTIGGFCCACRSWSSRPSSSASNSSGRYLASSASVRAAVRRPRSIQAEIASPESVSMISCEGLGQSAQQAAAAANAAASFCDSAATSADGSAPSGGSSITARANASDATRRASSAAAASAITVRASSGSANDHAERPMPRRGCAPAGSTAAATSESDAICARHSASVVSVTAAQSSMPRSTRGPGPSTPRRPLTW